MSESGEKRTRQKSAVLSAGLISILKQGTQGCRSASAHFEFLPKETPFPLFALSSIIFQGEPLARPRWLVSFASRVPSRTICFHV